MVNEVDRVENLVLIDIDGTIQISSADGVPQVNQELVKTLKKIKNARFYLCTQRGIALQEANIGNRYMVTEQYFTTSKLVKELEEQGIHVEVSSSIDPYYGKEPGAYFHEEMESYENEYVEMDPLNSGKSNEERAQGQVYSQWRIYNEGYIFAPHLIKEKMAFDKFREIYGLSFDHPEKVQLINLIEQCRDFYPQSKERQYSHLVQFVRQQCSHKVKVTIFEDHPEVFDKVVDEDFQVIDVLHPAKRGEARKYKTAEELMTEVMVLPNKTPAMKASTAIPTEDEQREEKLIDATNKVKQARTELIGAASLEEGSYTVASVIKLYAAMYTFIAELKRTGQKLELNKEIHAAADDLLPAYISILNFYSTKDLLRLQVYLQKCSLSFMHQGELGYAFTCMDSALVYLIKQRKDFFAAIKKAENLPAQRISIYKNIWEEVTKKTGYKPTEDEIKASFAFVNEADDDLIGKMLQQAHEFEADNSLVGLFIFKEEVIHAYVRRNGGKYLAGFAGNDFIALKAILNRVVPDWEKNDNEEVYTKLYRQRVAILNALNVAGNDQDPAQQRLFGILFNVSTIEERREFLKNERTQVFLNNYCATATYQELKDVAKSLKVFPEIIIESLASEKVQPLSDLKSEIETLLENPAENIEKLKEYTSEQLQKVSLLSTVRKVIATHELIEAAAKNPAQYAQQLVEWLLHNESSPEYENAKKVFSQLRQHIEKDLYDLSLLNSMDEIKVAHAALWRLLETVTLLDTDRVKAIIPIDSGLISKRFHDACQKNHDTLQDSINFILREKLHLVKGEDNYQSIQHNDWALIAKYVAANERLKEIEQSTVAEHLNEKEKLTQGLKKLKQQLAQRFGTSFTTLKLSKIKTELANVFEQWQMLNDIVLIDSKLIADSLNPLSGEFCRESLAEQSFYRENLLLGYVIRLIQPSLAAGNQQTLQRMEADFRAKYINTRTYQADISLAFNSIASDVEKIVKLLGRHFEVINRALPESTVKDFLQRILDELTLNTANDLTQTVEKVAEFKLAFSQFDKGQLNTSELQALFNLFELILEIKKYTFKVQYAQNVNEAKRALNHVKVMLYSFAAFPLPKEFQPLKENLKGIFSSAFFQQLEEIYLDQLESMVSLTLVRARMPTNITNLDQDLSLFQSDDQSQYKNADIIRKACARGLFKIDNLETALNAANFAETCANLRDQFVVDSIKKDAGGEVKRELIRKKWMELLLEYSPEQVNNIFGKERIDVLRENLVNDFIEFLNETTSFTAVPLPANVSSKLTRAFSAFKLLLSDRNYFFIEFNDVLTDVLKAKQEALIKLIKEKLIEPWLAETDKFKHLDKLKKLLTEVIDPVLALGVEFPEKDRVETLQQRLVARMSEVSDTVNLILRQPFTQKARLTELNDNYQIALASINKQEVSQVVNAIKYTNEVIEYLEENAPYFAWAEIQEKAEAAIKFLFTAKGNDFITGDDRQTIDSLRASIMAIVTERLLTPWLKDPLKKLPDLMVLLNCLKLAEGEAFSSVKQQIEEHVEVQRTYVKSCLENPYVKFRDLKELKAKHLTALNLLGLDSHVIACIQEINERKVRVERLLEYPIDNYAELKQLSTDDDQEKNSDKKFLTHFGLKYEIDRKISELSQRLAFFADALKNHPHDLIAINSIIKDLSILELVKIPELKDVWQKSVSAIQPDQISNYVLLLLDKHNLLGLSREKRSHMISAAMQELIDGKCPSDFARQLTTIADSYSDFDNLVFINQPTESDVIALHGYINENLNWNLISSFIAMRVESKQGDLAARPYSVYCDQAKIYKEKYMAQAEKNEDRWKAIQSATIFSESERASIEQAAKNAREKANQFLRIVRDFDNYSSAGPSAGYWYSESREPVPSESLGHDKNVFEFVSEMIKRFASSENLNINQIENLLTILKSLSKEKLAQVKLPNNLVQAIIKTATLHQLTTCVELLKFNNEDASLITKECHNLTFFYIKMKGRLLSAIGKDLFAPMKEKINDSEIFSLTEDEFFNYLKRTELVQDAFNYVTTKINQIPKSIPWLVSLYDQHYVWLSKLNPPMDEIISKNVKAWVNKCKAIDMMSIGSGVMSGGDVTKDDYSSIVILDWSLGQASQSKLISPQEMQLLKESGLHFKTTHEEMLKKLAKIAKPISSVDQLYKIMPDQEYASSISMGDVISANERYLVGFATYLGDEVDSKTVMKLSSHNISQEELTQKIIAGMHNYLQNLELLKASSNDKDLNPQHKYLAVLIKVAIASQNSILIDKSLQEVTAYINTLDSNSATILWEELKEVCKADENDRYKRNRELAQNWINYCSQRLIQQAEEGKENLDSYAVKLVDLIKLNIPDVSAKLKSYSAEERNKILQAIYHKDKTAFEKLVQDEQLTQQILASLINETAFPQVATDWIQVRRHFLIQQAKEIASSNYEVYIKVVAGLVAQDRLIAPLIVKQIKDNAEGQIFLSEIIKQKQAKLFVEILKEVGEDIKDFHSISALLSRHPVNELAAVIMKVRDENQDSFTHVMKHIKEKSSLQRFAALFVCFFQDEKQTQDKGYKAEFLLRIKSFSSDNRLKVLQYINAKMPEVMFDLKVQNAALQALDAAVFENLEMPVDLEIPEEAVAVQRQQYSITSQQPMLDYKQEFYDGNCLLKSIMDLAATSAQIANQVSMLDSILPSQQQADLQSYMQHSAAPMLSPQQKLQSGELLNKDDLLALLFTNDEANFDAVNNYLILYPNAADDNLIDNIVHHSVYVTQSNPLRLLTVATVLLNFRGNEPHNIDQEIKTIWDKLVTPGPLKFSSQMLNQILSNPVLLKAFSYKNNYFHKETVQAQTIAGDNKLRLPFFNAIEQLLIKAEKTTEDYSLLCKLYDSELGDYLRAESNEQRDKYEAKIKGVMADTTQKFVKNNRASFANHQVPFLKEMLAKAEKNAASQDAEIRREAGRLLVEWMHNDMKKASLSLYEPVYKNITVQKAMLDYLAHRSDGEAKIQREQLIMLVNRTPSNNDKNKYFDRLFYYSDLWNKDPAFNVLLANTLYFNYSALRTDSLKEERDIFTQELISLAFADKAKFNKLLTVAPIIRYIAASGDDNLLSWLSVRTNSDLPAEVIKQIKLDKSLQARIEQAAINVKQNTLTFLQENQAQGLRWRVAWTQAEIDSWREGLKEERFALERKYSAHKSMSMYVETGVDYSVWLDLSRRATPQQEGIFLESSTDQKDVYGTQVLSLARQYTINQGEVSFASRQAATDLLSTELCPQYNNLFGDASRLVYLERQQSSRVYFSPEQRQLSINLKYEASEIRFNQYIAPHMNGRSYQDYIYSPFFVRPLAKESVSNLEGRGYVERRAIINVASTENESSYQFLSHSTVYDSARVYMGYVCDAFAAQKNVLADEKRKLAAELAKYDEVINWIIRSSRRGVTLTPPPVGQGMIFQKAREYFKAATSKKLAQTELHQMQKKLRETSDQINSMTEWLQSIERPEAQISVTVPPVTMDPVINSLAQEAFVKIECLPVTIFKDAINEHIGMRIQELRAVNENNPEFIQWLNTFNFYPLSVAKPKAYPGYDHQNPWRQAEYFYNEIQSLVKVRKLINLLEEKLAEKGKKENKYLGSYLRTFMMGGISELLNLFAANSIKLSQPEIEELFKFIHDSDIKYSRMNDVYNYMRANGLVMTASMQQHLNILYAQVQLDNLSLSSEMNPTIKSFIKEFVTKLLAILADKTDVEARLIEQELLAPAFLNKAYLALLDRPAGEINYKDPATWGKWIDVCLTTGLGDLWQSDNIAQLHFDASLIASCEELEQLKLLLANIKDKAPAIFQQIALQVDLHTVSSVAEFWKAVVVLPIPEGLVNLLYLNEDDWAYSLKNQSSLTGPWVDVLRLRENLDKLKVDAPALHANLTHVDAYDVKKFTSWISFVNTVLHDDQVELEAERAKLSKYVNCLEALEKLKQDLPKLYDIIFKEGLFDFTQYESWNYVDLLDKVVNDGALYPLVKEELEPHHKKQSYREDLSILERIFPEVWKGVKFTVDKYSSWEEFYSNTIDSELIAADERAILQGWDDLRDKVAILKRDHPDLYDSLIEKMSQDCIDNCRTWNELSAAVRKVDDAELIERFSKYERSVKPVLPDSPRKAGSFKSDIPGVRLSGRLSGHFAAMFQRVSSEPAADLKVAAARQLFKSS